MFSPVTLLGSTLAVVFAFGCLAAPAGSGTAPSTPAAAVSSIASLSSQVDRTRKGDRLLVVRQDTPAASREPATSLPVETQPSLPRQIPVGCDPAFSTLSVFARLNFPSRCLADNAIGQAVLPAIG
jgi:hypothetical protein